MIIYELIDERTGRSVGVDQRIAYGRARGRMARILKLIAPIKPYSSGQVIIDLDGREMTVYPAMLQTRFKELGEQARIDSERSER